MGFVCQRRSELGRCILCAVGFAVFGPVLGLTCGAAALPGRAGQAEAGRALDSWDSALRARVFFEAEPPGTHTREEYARVMDGFRDIYHRDPGDPHAARAVVQVAELLAEQGRELNDRKSLRDAAGQYEFVAKAYPGASLAPVALGKALELLGPDAANDPAEARLVRAQLLEDYPRSAAAQSAPLSAETARTSPEAAQPSGSAARSSGEAAASGMEGAGPGLEATRIRQPAPIVRRSPGSAAASGRVSPPSPAEGAGSAATDQDGASPQSSVLAADSEGSGSEDSGSGESGSGESGNPVSGSGTRHNGNAGYRSDTGVAVNLAAANVPGRAHPAAPTGPLALVTGIRHWSTATYTRVAIDLSADSDAGVKYEAARVVNPDRIYFDLQHTKLTPQLQGKTFNVTDDGFLTKIRAARFSDDVTRVVLDVHQVAEYSAFLLPNPYRLIIDIHGRPNGQPQAASTEPAAAPPEAAEASSSPVARTAAAASGGGESSVLPPMAVTDGSARFGLPPRPNATSGVPAKATPASAAAVPVPRPRVVVSSRPTLTKPVPNAVAAGSSETGTQFGTEVAAVSRQPGRVEATSRPTSQPIVSRVSSTRTVSSASGAAPAAGGPPDASDSAGDANAAPSSTGEHYRPRSRRATAAAAGSTSQPAIVGSPAQAAPPTADGQTSMVRALGLKIGRIVIDAGHGGHDSGTLGVGGIEEKDVVLDVALRLGKLLHDRLGAEIVYTRADDTFIPLETRTAIANKAQADLFISVHANSSPDASARGVEVYYLNFTSDPDAMRVAARENAVSTQSVHELSDLVKQIALKDKIDESRELAADVDTSLFAGLTRGNPGLKNRGVKKAPFVVLIGANMPSVLAEISFVTNSSDAEKLQRPEYRERVAEALYAGIANYAAGINGSHPRARTTEQAER